jgi:esterase/lipase superfamily enzyme
LAILMIGGCASKPRQLMPTPALYQQPSTVPVFAQPREARGDDTAVDLLYITNRGPETDPESTLLYGQSRSKSIAFGSVEVEIGPNVSWSELERESTLAQRTRDLDLSLGQVREQGRFPREPYAIEMRPDGLYRGNSDLRQHDAADDLLRQEIQRRLARSPTKTVMLYVHGFNETFETAAFTAAELCHFLGREPVCAFFTWPASSTGNFLISYTNTTESAGYAENHLRKIIRLITTTPGVENVELLAHSRGTALLTSVVRDLLNEAVAAGKEPADVMHINNIVLFSPDIDIEVFAQDVAGGISDPDMFSVWPVRRVPRGINGRLTVYSSPQDRALLVSRILFRSRNRVGDLRPDDVPNDIQRYFEPMNKLDLIVYEGKRTDAFGHSYFTTNPQVSSDVIQLLRYGKKPGEPGRELIKAGPIAWEFPPAGASSQDD